MGHVFVLPPSHLGALRLLPGRRELGLHVFVGRILADGQADQCPVHFPGGICLRIGDRHDDARGHRLHHLRRRLARGIGRRRVQPDRLHAAADGLHLRGHSPGTAPEGDDQGPETRPRHHGVQIRSRGRPLAVPGGGLCGEAGGLGQAEVSPHAVHELRRRVGAERTDRHGHQEGVGRGLHARRHPEGRRSHRRLGGHLPDAHCATGGDGLWALRVRHLHVQVLQGQHPDVQERGLLRRLPPRADGVQVCGFWPIGVLSRPAGVDPRGGGRCARGAGVSQNLGCWQTCATRAK
mmetsp:Transcript_109543/g.285514  ORF Transcript_109543/g.285514 Transcript_109543/m.285514 type:complete len:293 (+) Transcript_109543:421-1299(+)